MRQRDLVRIIDTLVESSEHLNALVRMSPSRIQDALALISDPRALISMRSLLSTVRRLQTSSRIVPNGPRPALNPQPYDVQTFIGRLLASKSRFPSVAALAEFVQRAFELNTPPRARESRARYLSRISKALEERPDALRHAKRMLMAQRPDDRDEAYSLLYNFIRGRLTEAQ